MKLDMKIGSTRETNRKRTASISVQWPFRLQILASSSTHFHVWKRWCCQFYKIRLPQVFLFAHSQHKSLESSSTLIRCRPAHTKQKDLIAFWKRIAKHLHAGVDTMLQMESKLKKKKIGRYEYNEKEETKQWYRITPPMFSTYYRDLRTHPTNIISLAVSSFQVKISSCHRCGDILCTYTCFHRIQTKTDNDRQWQNWKYESYCALSSLVSECG